MAKIIQLIETDSTGHLVRLNDGHVVLLKHSDQGPPTVGSELNEDDFLFDHGKPTSIEQMNSDAHAEILAADRATDRREDLSEQTLDDRERG